MFGGHDECDAMVNKLEASWTDDCLREYWRRLGGSFHGPHIETGTMPESKLLPMLKYLLVKADLPPR